MHIPARCHRCFCKAHGFWLNAFNEGPSFRRAFTALVGDSPPSRHLNQTLSLGDLHQNAFDFIRRICRADTYRQEPSAWHRFPKNHWDHWNCSILFTLLEMQLFIIKYDPQQPQFNVATKSLQVAGPIPWQDALVWGYRIQCWCEAGSWLQQEPALQEQKEYFLFAIYSVTWVRIAQEANWQLKKQENLFSSFYLRKEDSWGWELALLKSWNPGKKVQIY